MKASLELKTPPVGVVLIFALFMWGAAVAFPALTLPLPWSSSLGAAFAFTGFIIAQTGLLQFRKARTTTNPIKPDAASSLVTSGIYQRTRNPMYLGLLLLLTGWAVYLSHLLSVLLLPGFVAYMTRFQILPEERVLTSKFGAEYKAYKQSVRRWL